MANKNNRCNLIYKKMVSAIMRYEDDPLTKIANAIVSAFPGVPKKDRMEYLEALIPILSAVHDPLTVEQIETPTKKLLEQLNKSSTLLKNSDISGRFSILDFDDYHHITILKFKPHSDESQENNVFM